MGSGKAEKPSSKKKQKLQNLNNTTKFKKQKQKKQKKGSNRVDDPQVQNNNNSNENMVVAEAPKPTSAPAGAGQQLSFFVNEFQSANGVKLSSLELESIKETAFVELGEEADDDVKALGKQMKGAFGSSWKEVLCEGQLVEGKIEPGSPAVLFISTSASRSIELLRGVRSLTRDCRAVKLFSKHMKVEEQVALLKNRVNLASGTPSRIKKLIDVEALGLSRLAIILLDLHTDVKGYSLLTLPQVRDEFWDLYKNYFHQRLLQGDLRICLFGPMPDGNALKGKKKRAPEE